MIMDRIRQSYQFFFHTGPLDIQLLDTGIPFFQHLQAVLRVFQKCIHRAYRSAVFHGTGTKGLEPGLHFIVRLCIYLRFAEIVMHPLKVHYRRAQLLRRCRIGWIDRCQCIQVFCRYLQ